MKNIRKMVKFSVKGVPVLPIFLMSIITVAAVLVATTSISSTITISSPTGLVLLFAPASPAGVCSNGNVGAAATSLSLPGVFTGVVNTIWSNTTNVQAANPPGYFNTNLGYFCLSNTTPNNIFIIPASFGTTGVTPSGLTFQVAAASIGTVGGGIIVSGATFCILPGTQVLRDSACSSVLANGPLALKTVIPSTATAGSYSWTYTVSFYSTASG